ncbi:MULTISPECIES: ABC transporter ATP-binding protein [Streptomyces]|jgi:ABC-2 type transport system ATP-binding protein|uniref:ABC transporter ATP-binding protein n=1 Tax=unclassified Streptomyces TaxID=2593676 RepID=UPI000891EBC4|nr:MULTISPECIES: ABC transporter ATP-binding protein [unclassified Streptomyces]MDX2728914.1 ABC transporter ATP-binding protein [Streptomyces sp. PA03-2a]MDX3771313.1 ABC transporter ATP-binding protein [Streptomyces sp. AK08-01B]MDX3816669.1 ABC transporter ATP-binding protein [Streptomyces sp. AK08-01A]SCY78073.1 ABC-2 type transport system ATP-binding protein [Streptomyces sp. 136MFCol5.1]
MTSDECVIEADGVRRRYAGGFEAVTGISFSVARGEIFALLGTNGAGKTSTVELLEGLARPDGGTVRVLGHDPYRERAAVRPRIGVMLQEGGFPSDLTVAETLRMWSGCTSAPRPTGEALELVGLRDRARVRVKQLSGGEKRRLDLALALLGRPDVLFLDEPTTGLDAEGRRDTWELVRTLRGGGTTVLLTTHYLEEAESLADRLAIMHRGRIVVAGTPAEVTASRPARIRFELPDGVGARRLPLGLRAAADGRRIEIRTHRLQESLGELLRWAQESDVELLRLDARSASLEEAFLDIARTAHDSTAREASEQEAAVAA